MKLTQGTYMRLLGVLFLVIAFGSCFSFGFRWGISNPGERLVSFAFILMYFMGFWFFYNMGRTMQSNEAKMPTAEEADKIIKEWEQDLKPKKRKR